MIQDANPSDHTFPDVSCECETLELDSQPKIVKHTEVNHDDVLSDESSNGETEASEHCHDMMQTQRATAGLVDSSHHHNHITVSADMSQPLHPVPVDHSKCRARMIRNRTLVQCSYEPVGDKTFSGKHMKTLPHGRYENLVDPS